MKLNKIQLLNLFVFAAFFFQSHASAEVVYDSLSTPKTFNFFTNELGNTVTLSGSKRFVTSFTVNVEAYSSSIGKTTDYILSFYVPSAPDDYPGKLIWQSPPKAEVITGGIQSITFEVPYVRVPDTFIFLVKIGGGAYFTLCNGPTIGSSPNYSWPGFYKYTSSVANHLQAKIETQDRTDAVLLGRINHNSFISISPAIHHTMQFYMKLGEDTFSLYGLYFSNITQLDEGSYLQLDAADEPEAIDYLTNGVDNDIYVSLHLNTKGNVESDTIVKTPGIAEGFPDFYGCIITDIGLKLDNIVIDHSIPDNTYYVWDVTWEIWGFEKSPDLDRNGKVNFSDFAILASALNSQKGRPNWNPICDIYLPEDKKINLLDFQRFCLDWLYGCSIGLEENFETGDFSLYGWQHSGDAGWNIVSDIVYEGTYSAKSGVITHSRQSTLQVEIDVDGEYISFFRKVSSESGFDYLRFFIDDVEQDKWSGEIDWSQESFPVTPGSHTFKWSYTKDSTVSVGSDCAWLDQIKVE